MSEESNKTKYDEKAASEKSNEAKDATEDTSRVDVSRVTPSQIVIRTDEPPIGAGACSFFFDLNVRIGNLATPTTVGNISKYRLHQNYTGIETVGILTENNNTGGTITFDTYPVPLAETHAKLILTLRTTLGNKQITLPVDNNGTIDVEGGLRDVHDDTRKTRRPHRAKYFDPDSRVIAWRIVDSSNNVIVVDGKRYEDAGGDLYYFYISMHH